MPTVPEHLQQRANQYIARAKRLDIGESRLLQYAAILVAAEYEGEFNAVGEDHAVLARHEIVGEMYGFKGGYQDPDAARRLQSRGRIKSQQLSASLRGAYVALKRAEKLLTDNLDSLPLYIRQGYPPKMSEVLSIVRRLWQDAEPGENLLKKNSRRFRTLLPDAPAERLRESQTLLWWHFYILPRYPGKWKDMFELATLWDLTGCQDPEDFRRQVMRLAKGVTKIRACPPWATR